MLSKNGFAMDAKLHGWAIGKESICWISYKKASEEVFSQLGFAFCVSMCENMIPGGFVAILWLWQNKSAVKSYHDEGGRAEL